MDNYDEAYMRWVGKSKILGRSLGLDIYKRCGYYTAANNAEINKNIKIPSFVQAIELRGFYENSNIETLEIPESVQIIRDEAFLICDNLRKIGFKCDNVDIRNRAFFGCISLEEIELNRAKIGVNTFCNCKSLRKIKINQCELDDGAFFSCWELVDAYIGECKVIPNNCFRSCLELERVRGINISEVLDWGFNGCEKLKELDLSKIEHIGKSAFEKCMELKVVNLPYIKNIGEMAFFNSGIEEIDISNIEDAKNIGHRCLFWCRRLRKIRLNKRLRGKVKISDITDTRDVAIEYI